jgi:superfamily II DNA or RNA helicase
MQARPYQLEACNAVVKEWEKGNRSTMIVLPTGCGKTVIFAGITYRCANQKQKVLILAHQKNLIDQAADKIERMFNLKTFREKGKNDCRKCDENVIVSCYQTISRRLDRYSDDLFDYIIIDECHHAWANGYQKILEHFKKSKILGVTATPYRADGKDLSDVFQSTAYTYTIDQAQKEGFLAPSVIVEPSESFSIDFSKIKMQNGDFEKNALAETIEPYLQIIAEDMRKNEEIHNRKIVIFVPLIATAQRAAETFSHYGFRTMWTSGEDKEKEEKLKKFDTWDKGVICSSLLLTEGWDCPSVDCVVVLRPTTSKALYTQMIGRGLRLSEGKENCIIYDVLCLHDSMGTPKPKKQKEIEQDEKDPAEKTEEELQKDLERPLVDRYASLKERLARAEESRAKRRVCQKEAEWNERLTGLDCKQNGMKNPFEICPILLRESQYSVFAGENPYKISPGHKEFLNKRNIDHKYLNWKQVRTLINYLKETEPPSRNQKYRLTRMGFGNEEIESMTMVDATKILNAFFASGNRLTRNNFAKAGELWIRK